jgi:hypothetical protein
VWRPGASPKQLNIRVSGDPHPAVDAVRRAARELDSSIPILNVRTIEQMIDDNIMQEKLIASPATPEWESLQARNGREYDHDCRRRRQLRPAEQWSYQAR